MSLDPEEAPQDVVPVPSDVEIKSADEAEQPVWEPTSSPVQAEPNSAATPEPSLIPLPETVPPLQSDPAWNGWDLVRLVFLTIVALVVGVLVVMFVAHMWIYPHKPLADIARIPLVAVAGQCLAYFLVLGYMWVLVARERRRPDVLNAIHWNWPSKILGYVMAGLRCRSDCKALLIFCRFRKTCRSIAFSVLQPRLGPLASSV